MNQQQKGYRELPVERWSRQIASRELGLSVDRFENGTSNGMVDAVIRAPFGLIPLEVVQDVNVPERRQTEAFQAHGAHLQVPGIGHGWYMSILHSARVKTVREVLPGLLRRLDEILDDRPGWVLSKSQELWGEEVPRPLQRLGVQFMAPLFDERGRDLIVLGGEGWSGTDEPDRLNSWVLEVLEREDDVPKKIRSFAGGHGDVFIWATLASDLTVTGLLTDPDVALIPRLLPDRAPELPPGVDRVWVACTLARRRAVVAEGGRWRWLEWVADVSMEDEGEH
ncbi:hypothetical protein DEJ13_17550 [Curtobacterium sp. MCLR17_007]|uniref:hypothetical protein n=1 Tax=Curtobacterium sp. MCLR17_007 TaxID=2175648 RepID=UPI000DA82D4A|nr:hypothetical protein [Curtobacterium sp. MCLR17_007]WIB60221.1 hypothetical protein DEJ13_17550 [Curtobacterium sp. MCLR17_007]